jgi:hypothetical protein
MAETKEGGVYLAADGKTRINAHGEEIKAAAAGAEKKDEGGKKEK